MATARINMGSIDDILGPASDRFFGAAFRRVGHRIQDIGLGVGEAGEGYVRGTASIGYPPNWSKRDGGVVPPPHLSSVDAVLLGAQLAETYLTRVFRLTEAQRQRMWLSRFDMRPGAKPLEDLLGFEISATCVETCPSSDGLRSVFDCRLGTIKIRCEVEHEIGEPVAPDGFYPDVDDVLGAANGRHYGDGYKLREQLIENVSVDLDEPRVDAVVRVARWHEDSYPSGIEACYQPTLSMIDSVLIMGQLGEVLVYQQDNVDRKVSNPLWLRRLVIERTQPRRSPGSTFDTSVVVTKNQRLTLGGAPWRSCDLVGECAGITVRYRLAHELPWSVA